MTDTLSRFTTQGDLVIVIGYGSADTVRTMILYSLNTSGSQSVLNRVYKELIHALYILLQTTQYLLTRMQTFFGQ